ncbi:unnamed protein product, partial [Candidula unifasciata]
MQGKILNDNRSSYNLIAHDHYVPPSPPFGPAPRHAYLDPRRDYEAPRTDGRGNVSYHVTSNVRFSNDGIRHENHLPFSPLYRPGQSYAADPRYRNLTGDGRQNDVGRDHQGQTQLVDGAETSQKPQGVKGSLAATIGQINHVPVSPLYRPGQGRGLAMADPRYGSPQRRRQDERQE